MYIPRTLRLIAAENRALTETDELRDRLIDLIDHDVLVRAAVKRHTVPAAPPTPRGGARRG